MKGNFTQAVRTDTPKLIGYPKFRMTIADIDEVKNFFHSDVADRYERDYPKNKLSAK